MCHVTYLSDRGNHVADGLFSICIHNCEALTKITKYLTESQKIKKNTFLYYIMKKIAVFVHHGNSDNNEILLCVSQCSHIGCMLQRFIT